MFVLVLNVQQSGLINFIFIFIILYFYTRPIIVHQTRQRRRKVGKLILCRSECKVSQIEPYCVSDLDKERNFDVLFSVPSRSSSNEHATD